MIEHNCDRIKHTSAESAGLIHRNSETHADRFIVAREQKTWSSLSRFVVAVDGLPRVTSTYMQSETTFGGVPHHFLLGGDNGMLHVHSLAGALILDYETEGASPITALVEKRKRCVPSIAMFKNAPSLLQTSSTVTPSP